jgi:hypothetical protein
MMVRPWASIGSPKTDFTLAALCSGSIQDANNWDKLMGEATFSVGRHFGLPKCTLPREIGKTGGGPRKREVAHLLTRSASEWANGLVIPSRWRFGLV